MTATIIVADPAAARCYTGRPVDRCHQPCHWCPMSDLPVYECAMPCHRNERLPAGLKPAEEPVRGVEPTGVAVWPPSNTKARLHHAAGAVHVDRLGRRSSVLLPLAHHKRPRDTGTCHWVADLEQWCTPEHIRDCRSTLCRGCKPCPEHHCAHRGTCPNHVDRDAGIHTCPQCIGRVRAAIADLVDETVLLSAELEHAGIDSEASNLAGPSASFDQLIGQLELDQARGWCTYPRRGRDIYDGTLTSTGEWRDNLDTHHPYAVLTRWEHKLRHNAGVAPATYTTVTTAAAYITRALATRMPHNVDVFDDLARDISSCKTWVDTVLSNSRRPETGIPCPKCAGALHDAGIDGTAARVVKRHDNADSTGSSDVWVCPDIPTHQWKEADYRLRVYADYLDRADRLTSAQLRKQYGITPGNLHRWANGWTNESGNHVDPIVAKRGRDAQGHLLYDVADARRAEDRRRGWCDYPRVTALYPPTQEATS